MGIGHWASMTRVTGAQRRSPLSVLAIKKGAQTIKQYDQAVSPHALCSGAHTAQRRAMHLHGQRPFVWLGSFSLFPFFLLFTTGLTTAATLPSPGGL